MKLVLYDRPPMVKGIGFSENPHENNSVMSIFNPLSYDSDSAQGTNLELRAKGKGL